MVTFDIYHENQATADFSSNRACIVHTLDDWGQIGQPMAAPSEEWERISQEFTYHKQAEKYDGTMQDVKLLYIEFAYPEATQSQGDSYKIENKEEYYIDNFSIKKYVAPTPKPEASPTPVPPVDEPTIAPPAATPYVDTTVGSGLENGYEEAVGNLLYVVTGNDTVQVKEFDTPKSSLVIPDTVVIEDYTFKVTSIAANAFKGDSDIKKLTIGANVTTIGKNAFFKCTSLKKITIKSSSITSIGKKAFKKTSAKATVKVPKAKKAAYKKLLKKAGIAKKAKIK
ncbi:MAG: leucine-rich repeat domain-containing protein [Christensenellales bacterium]